MGSQIRIARGRWRLVLLPLLFAATGQAAPPAGDTLPADLRRGGYVILMRHASSPATPPSPATADPDNTRRERQLDAAGRDSARALGAALRRLHIPIGEVLCSPTYRALETLRLAGWASPTIDPELGDAGHSMQADVTGRRGAWIRARVAAAPAHGPNTLIVTQMPNITEAYPHDATDLQDGAALILRPDGRGSARLIARVRIGQWVRWARLPGRRPAQ